MSRKNKEELEVLKEKYSTDMLWSWSRYNCYKQDKYEYFLKYILKLKEDRTDGIYGISGGNAHSIIEDFYEGKIKYDDMIHRYEDSLFTMNLSDLKYDRSNNDKNELVANNYESSLKHFFCNHQPISQPHKIEQFIIVNIDGNIFQGYVDFIHTEKQENENGECQIKIVITDWKTSTIYKGEKINIESGQLLLYSEGIRQTLNIPLENISARWAFLKYVTVHCMQANKKWKERFIKRNAIAESLASSVKMWLKKSQYNENDIEKYVGDMILSNSIEELPEEIKNKFVIMDCYVNVPVTEENIEKLKQTISDTIKEIRSNTNEYNDTKDENIFWQEVTDKDSFKLGVLSGYSRKLHKPYNKYLEELELFKIGEDTENENNHDEDLINFLNEL